jgi:hypothetical protein
VIFVLTTTCDCCIGILGWDEFCDLALKKSSYFLLNENKTSLLGSFVT